MLTDNHAQDIEFVNKCSSPFAFANNVSDLFIIIIENLENYKIRLIFQNRKAPGSPWIGRSMFFTPWMFITVSSLGY